MLDDADKQRIANLIQHLDAEQRRFLEKWLKMMEVAAQHEQEEQLYARETREGSSRQAHQIPIR